MRSAVPLLLPILTGLADAASIWAQLYSRVSEMIRRVLGASRATWRDPRREDLLADATYAALTNICCYRSGFRGTSEGEARAWLRTVSRNSARRVARRHSRWWKCHVPTDPASLDSLSDARGHDAPEVLSPCEARRLLARALPSPALRRLWLLSNWPGTPLNCAEIAALTGRTPGSVAVSLSRARSAIRRELLMAGHVTATGGLYPGEAQPMAARPAGGRHGPEDADR